jgi:hypothetical protein
MPRTGVPMPSSSGSLFGAPGSSTLFGPPDRMMPTGFVWRFLPRRGARRQDFREDGQLAKPARDQLRELRAEVENNNRLMCHRRPDGPIGAPAKQDPGRRLVGLTAIISV